MKRSRKLKDSRIEGLRNYNRRGRQINEKIEEIEGFPPNKLADREELRD